MVESTMYFTDQLHGLWVRMTIRQFYTLEQVDLHRSRSKQHVHDQMERWIGLNSEGVVRAATTEEDANLAPALV